jgi:hypothetical protein
MKGPEVYSLQPGRPSCANRAPARAGAGPVVGQPGGSARLPFAVLYSAPAARATARDGAGAGSRRKPRQRQDAGYLPRRSRIAATRRPATGTAALAGIDDNGRT